MLEGDGISHGGWMGLGAGGRLQAGWAGEQVVCQVEHCVVKFFPSDSLGSRTGGAVPRGQCEGAVRQASAGSPESQVGMGTLTGGELRSREKSGFGARLHKLWYIQRLEKCDYPRKKAIC